MVERASLPGEMILDAIVIDPIHGVRSWIAASDDDRSSWARPARIPDDLLEAAKRRGPYIALRWILNTTLGIPLEPFTVWRRPSSRREAAEPINGWHALGPDTFWWDGVSEMLRIELDVSSAVTVQGLSRIDHAPVAVASGGPGTVVLEGAPMLGVRLSNPGAVIDARGLSVNRAANGDGWTRIERVGLPLPPQLTGQSYYDPTDQGPVGAPVDPVTAAVDRLLRWGPVLGWPPLAGLPPWEAPDAGRLVDELAGDVLRDLVAVMTANPPPGLAKQRTAERPPRPLAELRQAFAIGSKSLNGPGDNQRSEIVTRPLQGVAMAVAADTWASLALGFGTGAALGDRGRAGFDDFMVTAPWHGLLEVALPTPFPWPWGAPPARTITEEVKRELVAVVLSPTLRDAPGVPSPLAAAPTYPEGVVVVDGPYLSATKVETPRPEVLPNAPRPSAYGLARFDGAGAGRYELRRHPTAGGWIPIGSATPVREPEQLPDPALTPNTVMLRDSGVARPLNGPSIGYQYAVAATDLFGQWSGWGTSWLALGPAEIGVPSVAVVRATASPGPDDADPCSLSVSAEVVWDASERTASRMRVVVDVFEPYPAPPAPLAAPAATPQAAWTAADVTFSFDGQGNPVGLPASVSVVELHADDRPVTAADPSDSTERRYRITVGDVAVTFGSSSQKGVAIYCQVEETVRPGEWGGWGHAQEMAIAPNPLPPATPVPLPPEYPLWASLPNAAGLSYAPVSWTPTGAWRYRVYEATEAAILAACGQPGPVLTDGYGTRMQRLFDLHAVGANLPKIKAAYRKLGSEPISPTVHGGEMRFEALLPRGSSLIHCFIVVGVTESNVISGWPVPDADGRNGFLAYAIPHPVRPPMPQVRAAIGASGAPEVQATFAGATPVTAIRLYRATSTVRARQVGLMELVATVAPDPVDWQTTVITDPAAPVGWDRLQYRVVGLPDDDLDRAGMAVESLPSKAYALLNPPPGAPDLVITEETAAASLTVAVATLQTSAPRRPKQIGDHTVSWSVRSPDGTLVRGSVIPPELDDFPTLGAFLAGPTPAGYVGGLLRIRLDRTAGEALTLAVDVTDPLARTAHALFEVPEFVPDPAPVIENLQVARHATLLDQAVHVGFETNVPLPPNPLRDWTVLIRYRRAGPFFAPTTTRTFGIASLPTIPTAADMPMPLSVAKQWLVRRVEGTGMILFWAQVGQPQVVTVIVTNATGQSATKQQVTP